MKNKILVHIELAVKLILMWALHSSAFAEVNVENNGNIARSLFTTAIVNNEPSNRLLVGSDLSKVYFFTEILNMEGQTIYHRWEFQDKVITRSKFEVKNSNSRVYSSIKIKPDKIGKWTVVVTDERGWPLKAVIFHHVKRNSQTDYPDVILPAN